MKAALFITLYSVSPLIVWELLLCVRCRGISSASLSEFFMCVCVCVPARAQEEPLFNMPSRILAAVVELDKLVTQWRVRHAIMVHGCVFSSTPPPLRLLLSSLLSSPPHLLIITSSVF